MKKKNSIHYNTRSYLAVVIFVDSNSNDITSLILHHFIGRLRKSGGQKIDTVSLLLNKIS